MLPAPAPAFTPYVPRVRDEARRALGALLGLPPERLTWTRPAADAPPLALAVRVGDPARPALELDLAPAAPGARAWLVGRRVALSYRKGRDGGDPLADPASRALLEAVRARVAAADEAPEGEGPLAAAAAALAEAERFREVEDYMFRQARPRELVLRLGFRCNQDCWFCWQGRHWPEPPAEVFAAWLDEAAAAGHRAIFFSGGEPTLHRALPDLVRRARREHGMMVWLQTNAIRLGKPDYLATLRDAGLDGVFVSYHSADPAVSEAMTRAPRTHALTERGLEACLAAGLTVELNCVVERANHATLAEHARHVVRRFVEPFPANPVSRVSYSHPHEYYDRDAFEASFVGLDAIRAPLAEAVDVLLAAGVAVEGIGTCGFPPCLLRDRPDVLRWLVPAEEHPMDAEARAYGDACAACAVRDRCLGVRREYLERLGEAGLVPFATAPA